VGVIFLRHGESFVPMREEQYEAEVLLQGLIAAHPQILAGDESGERSMWVLVKWEAGISVGSLDHLFLDEDGVPTLVEVKRSSDARARREVVAQMLDYAANAAVSWDVELLRGWFEETCKQAAPPVEPEDLLASTLRVSEPDRFWEAFKTNLAAERFRLVFVADTIPSELRAMIEFLNRQMQETEVYAIEVKQYVDALGERQTIVPRVLGQTATKVVRPTRKWNRELLLEQIQGLDPHGAEFRRIAESVIEWAESEQPSDVHVDYGTGREHGSAKVKLHRDRTALTGFLVWTDGSVQIDFSATPFAESAELRDELWRRINEAVPEAEIPPEDEKRRVRWFSLGALSDKQVQRDFFSSAEWAFDELRRAHPEAS
jgi:hypothetical protein